MYAKISNKLLQGKNESQHTLNNVGVLWLYASAMDLYCGCGQRWSSSLIILHSKCPSVNIGSYYKEIGMYLPGSPRGFWIELENPKIREIKKNYLHKYSLFVGFSFLGSLSPLFSGKRTLLSSGGPVLYSSSGMTLHPCSMHTDRVPCVLYFQLCFFVNGYENQVVPISAFPDAWDQNAEMRVLSSFVR